MTPSQDADTRALAVLLCEYEAQKGDVTRAELERAGEWPCVRCKRVAAWLAARGVRLFARSGAAPRE